MYEQVKNTKENKRLSPPNKISRKQSGSKSTFQFVDNRPEAIAQRKLQEMANNSPEAKQSAQLKSEPIKVHGSNQRVIQRFDAGIGAGWHVHFGSHLKYNGNNATRVNFPGRSQIGRASCRERVSSPV